MVVDPSLAAKAEAQARAYALTLRDAPAVAKAMAKWVQENCPQLLGTGYWVMADQSRDKGITVDIAAVEYRPTLKARLQALLGLRTAGIGVSADIRHGSNGATYGIGLGAATIYGAFERDFDLKAVQGLAYFTVRL